MPFSRIYNLARLGQAGDEVRLEMGEDERAALAGLAGALAVPQFSARIALKKLSPTRFELHYDLAAAVIQACVVTLEPVASQIARNFVRELHFIPNLRRARGGEPAEKAAEKEIVLAPGDEELAEEIDTLHYDLPGPAVEEFLLALDPYPRAPGVEFAPPAEPGERLENPFAVLKGLKSGD